MGKGLLFEDFIEGFGFVLGFRLGCVMKAGLGSREQLIQKKKKKTHTLSTAKNLASLKLLEGK